MAWLKEEKLTSVDRKPEVAQNEEVPIENTKIIPEA